MNNVFISGEKIDLCVPVESDYEVWASWFNSQKITMFLEQGKFPQTRKMQVDFFENATSNGRFLAVIKNKKSNLLGVISLSDINYEKLSCQVALVCPIISRDAPLAGLEAMALVSEHAFERLGMTRVWAGQAYPGLKKWTHKLEVIGYKSEGFARNKFKHGVHVSDAVNIAIVKNDYLKICSRRNGKLWPGESIVKKMIKEYCKSESLADKLSSHFIDSYSEQELILENLDAQYSK